MRTLAHRCRFLPCNSCVILAGLIFLSYQNLLAQTNYTVGDPYGNDHSAFLFSPFRWEGDWGNDYYDDHVCLAQDWSSGQQYIHDSWGFCEDPYGPLPYGGSCSLYGFLEMISNQTDNLGVLLISSHGADDHFSVECYDKSPQGRANWMAAVEEYALVFQEGVDFYYMESESWMSIGVFGQFIRSYGHLNQSLVFVNTCAGATLADDFVVAGARVAVGHTDHPTGSQLRPRILSFFSRLDGKEGRQNRTVLAAYQGLTLSASGALNTTLAPAVMGVAAPNPLRVGDFITLTLDTKCDTWITPTIYCDWCGLGNVQWSNDSTMIWAMLVQPPPLGITECQFTLNCNVRSARNDSYLDGNTDPPGGSNAEGPAHDDYEWTMAVSSCNCGRRTTPKMWADVSNDNAIDPQDVNRMVNYVYKGQMTAIIAPPGAMYPNAPLPPTPPFTCQYRLGDVNRDGMVGPPDVPRYVNFVFKGQTDAILDNPCGP